MFTQHTVATFVDHITNTHVDGVTSQREGDRYDGIRACFLQALNDSEVKAICLDIDSPGGEVAGCFDLVDEIYAARGSKPVWAILSESAYSAAYALASAADKIILPRTGGVGSVGVIVMHVDWSQKIKNDGLQVTIITYGDRKAESNRIIIVESTMNTTELAQQAIDWEMNRRYGRSKVLQVTIDNWRDSAGKLWEPNTLIPVNIPKMGINDVLWLLAEVTFIKDDQGTVAQMVLMPPAAFSVQPYRFYNVIQELNR